MAVLSGVAMAQPGDCSCLVPAGANGVVQSVRGNVFVDSAPAKANMSIQAGSSVVVGPKSASSVSFGSGCALRLSANTALQAVPQGAQQCLTVSRQDAGVDMSAPAEVSNSGRMITPLTLAAGIGAGALIIGIAADDNSVSR